MNKKISSLLENQSIIWIGTILLTLVGLYLRFDKRLTTPLIGDETYVIAVLSRYENFLLLFNKLPYLEFSSYLTGDYYLLYPFVHLFDSNKWGVAIPHILSTLLCFYFLFKVCELHLNNAIGFWIAFLLVSFNSTLIEHSFEIRYYAVLQTLGLATYYFTHLLVHKPNPPSPMKWVGLIIFFGLVILFHLYCAIIVCANLAFFLVISFRDRSMGQTIKKLAPVFIPTLLITAPIMYYVLFVNFHVSAEIWYNNPFKFIPNPLTDVIGFLKGIVGNLIGFKLFYFLPLGLIISFCFPHSDRSKQFWFFLLLIILPIFTLLILDLKAGYWFIQRQFIWVMPFFAILLGWSWESMYSKFKPT